MKTIINNCGRKIIWMMIMLCSLIGANNAIAQLPDCSSGTVMYGVFSQASTVNDSTHIRSVNYATGAIGPLMGGMRYMIRKTIGASTYYGSAAMGLDVLTNRFYLFSQMSNAGGKDIFTVNPVSPLPTPLIIGTTPAALDPYHIVKTAIAPNGFGYAIGVHRDSTQPAATCNPLIRYSTCGFSPSAGCATASIITLGYLPPTGMTYKWNIFNGDIAFDNGGNLYFLSAAFERVSGLSRYTDVRLFRMNAADIPSSAGTGTLPMSFVADYNIIDSTGVSGIALDPAGAMYLSTKRFTGNNPSGTFTNELYKSSIFGSAAIMPGFAPIPTNTSIGDLAGCFFPTGVLATNKFVLQAKYTNKSTSLSWEVDNNSVAAYYEVQRSNDGNDFTTIGRVEASATTGAAKYTYTDRDPGFGKNKFYRVRQITRGAIRYYSNVENVLVDAKAVLVGAITPNPVINDFSMNVMLSSNNTISVKVVDQGGKVVYNNKYVGNKGENKIVVSNMNRVKAGVYVVEMSVDNEIVREKIIKQ